MLIKKLYTIFLRILFEKDALVSEIERMTPEDFGVRVRKSEHPSALFSYRDPLVKAAVWNMKFRRNIACFRIAGALMHEKLAVREKTLLIPIPLSPKRRRERGYNQAEALAKEIIRHDRKGLLTLSANVLRRRHARTQTSLGRSGRMENLKDAFKVTDPSLIEGKKIILLDDVRRPARRSIALRRRF